MHVGRATAMKRLILAGAGHAHARVLLEVAKSRVPDVEVILVSPVIHAPYSGMIPGWMAGYYRWEECCIDFMRLCERAGATVYVANLTGIDLKRCLVVLDNAETLPYDWLSLDVGSTLQTPRSDRIDVLPMRPLATLNTRWDTLLRRLEQLHSDGRIRVLMVGGGAAGVESVLSVWAGLRLAAPTVEFAFTLATQGREIVPALAAGAGRRLQRHLARRGIAVVHAFSADHIDGDAVVATDGRRLHADVVLWATGAQAHDWLARSGLPVDERGFVRVDRHLRVLGAANVFASGDCASWEPSLPKAGVFAVHMGPVLAHNLAAIMRAEALRSYRPQRRHLVLVGTGNRHAVASWGALAWQGAWVWRWKEGIDRRFVARNNQS